MSNWFNREAADVIRSFNSHWYHGLKSREAGARLEKYGFNQLQQSKKISPWQIFSAQFLDFMVLVLLGAAILSGILGERVDAITIIAIVVLNAILGFIQEFRAEKSLEALKELSAPQASVIRDGKMQRIAAKLLVPGDILVLESGDRIAADGRLFEEVDLEVNEATLTGESLAVSKNTAIIRDPRAGLGDQKNMVFAGTVVANGRGKAVVTATGMDTEIGKIAGMISSAEDEETPLQRRLDQLGRVLVVICLGVCAAVATMGILRGEPPRQMFLSAVSLAVAAIPEGLPAIVTIALAIGVQRMIRRNAIIRKLPAVETLGCATVICSDKTGTLTQNKLSVTRLWTPVNEYRSESLSSNAAGHSPDLAQLLEIGALCNNAQLEEEKRGQCRVIGDPTEGALLMAAEEAGMNLRELSKDHRRLGEIPFSSERKRMSVWVQDRHGQIRLYVKGAADVILERCSRVMTKSGIQPMNAAMKELIRSRVEAWGADALRVLAFAWREGERSEIGVKKADPEKGLIFQGLMGMTDPPRPESQMAVAKCRQAGIQVKMITGDYPRTAAAIGKMIGLLRSNGKIVTGQELDQMTDEQLAKVVGDIDIFARVAPHHKLRVVKALKEKGEIVAMTGDGVNDAPAIKEADIGVAMGVSGTDVSKEASAMVIADDNFATIVAAVEEGRMIYDNIRKFIRYLLSCNIGEILTMFGGIIMGLPVPLLPLQILWINLVTDGLPAIALGMDPAEPGIMKRRPRPANEGIFGRGLGKKIVFQGLMIGIATLTIFLLKLKNGDLILARTAAFNALVFSQLLFVFRCRSEYRSIFQINLLENRYLVGAVMISTTMQLLVTYLPALQPIFGTRSLSPQDWMIIGSILLSLTYFSDLVYQFRASLRKHLSVFRFKNA